MQPEEVKAAIFSILPFLALAIPLVGAALAALAGEKRARMRNWTAVVASGATLAVAFQLMVKVLSGSPAYFNLNIMRIGDQFVCNLQVDALGAFFCFFATVLWFAASLHAFKYMGHEHKRTRFFFFMLLTEAATLGVFLVQDFFSLYFFFEIMGLAAYMLVIHSETPMARSAATKYICMTVIGGLSLIGGIFLYLGYAGTVSFAPLVQSAWLAGSFKVVALVCLIAGFGVKAGMVPLHIWLPDAHPAAPSPASALLSGVMIKAGAYGIIRTCLTFFQQPAAHEAEAQLVSGTGHATEGAVHGASGLAANLQALGLAIICIAVVTMFVGMILALVQRDIKRTLAYSSVSQMGYILFGVGCMTFLGSEGAIGLGGSLYHIINHAFFKGCFFLAAGCILYCAHELDMFKLGGLWRRMPVTTIFWCIAALGIMGIALFNGFVSKTLLHHAILEAHLIAGESQLASAFWVKLAEIFFIITSGGTIAYITKMTYYTFFRRPLPENADHVEEVREAPAWMLAGTGILAVGVLFCGLFPGLMLDKVIGRVIGTVPGLDVQAVEHVASTPIFIWGNIKEIFIPLAIGITIFVLGAWPDLFRARRRGPDIFALRLPRWLGVDYWYVRGAQGSLGLLFAGRRVYAPLKEQVMGLFKRGSSATIHAAQGLKRAIPPGRPDEGALTIEPSPAYLKGAGMGYWFTRAAGRFQSVLLGGASGYAEFKRRAWAGLSGGGNRLHREVQERMPVEIRQLNRDIAVGTLAIAVVLTALLILRLA